MAQATTPSQIRPGNIFSSRSILKSDIFSTVERGTAETPEGPVEAVRRDTSLARWWAVPIAAHLHWRERRALAKVRSIEGVSQLVAADNKILVRTWIDGVPLQMAKPHGNEVFFATAKHLLRSMHRAGIVHNDLAKEPNWLVMPDGRAAVTDFQLASLHNDRGPLFRLLAYEDLRHLLKHKRKYCPQALTPKEKQILSRRSGLFRIGRAIKPVYAFVVHRFMGIRDREGGGLRYLEEAPFIESQIRTLPGVSAASVVSYHNKGEGVGLHAFVETTAYRDGESLIASLGSELGDVAPPERITLSEALPKGEDGQPMAQVMTLIAGNQIDQIEQLVSNDTEAQSAAQVTVQASANG